jgi:hypothetical protein
VSCAFVPAARCALAGVISIDLMVGAPFVDKAGMPPLPPPPGNPPRGPKIHTTGRMRTVGRCTCRDERGAFLGFRGVVWSASIGSSSPKLPDRRHRRPPGVCERVAELALGRPHSGLLVTGVARVPERVWFLCLMYGGHNYGLIGQTTPIRRRARRQMQPSTARPPAAIAAHWDAAFSGLRTCQYPLSTALGNWLTAAKASLTERDIS